MLLYLNDSGDTVIKTVTDSCAESKIRHIKRHTPTKVYVDTPKKECRALLLHSCFLIRPNKLLLEPGYSPRCCAVAVLDLYRKTAEPEQFGPAFVQIAKIFDIDDVLGFE